MAKSKAKKARLHKIRNGRMDPAEMRGISPDFSTHERKTPTKQSKLMKMEKKYKKSTFNDL